jgi:hypothetical protein
MHLSTVLTLLSALATHASPLSSRAPVALPDWSYNGCWTDAAERQLNGATYTSPTMTPSTCISFCSSRGYSFAGVEYANECYCGYALKLQSSLRGIKSVI